MKGRSKSTALKFTFFWLFSKMSGYFLAPVNLQMFDIKLFANIQQI